MAAKPLKKGATYDDLRRVPDNYVAEIFDGDLYASRRPAAPHSRAATKLAAKLDGPFDFEGAGGWILLIETELHFGNDVLVPDIAGWRRSRMSELPDAPFFVLAPDWICEVLSASTEATDRGEKMTVYARERVEHVWLVDPSRQTLEVLAVEDGRLESLEAYHGNASVRARPFDTFELELPALWI